MIEIHFDDELLRRVEIEPDQSDLMQLIDLTGRVEPDTLSRLRITDLSGSATGYQVLLRHHEIMNDGAQADGECPLAVDLAYGHELLRVGDWLPVTATVANRSSAPLPMVMLDLPVPPGFVIDRGSFDDLVASGRIARYEVTPRHVIVYLRQLRADEEWRLEYRLRATMPVEIEAPGATAWEYYNPALRSTTPSARLRVGM